MILLECKCEVMLLQHTWDMVKGKDVVKEFNNNFQMVLLNKFRVVVPLISTVEINNIKATKVEVISTRIIWI